MHSGISCTIFLPDLTPRFPVKPKPLSLPVGFRGPRKRPQPQPAQSRAAGTLRRSHARKFSQPAEPLPLSPIRPHPVEPKPLFLPPDSGPSRKGRKPAPEERPSACRDKTMHVNPRHPPHRARRTVPLPRRRLGQGRQRHPGKPMRRPLSVRESGRSKNRIVRSGTIARHPARAG